MYFLYFVPISFLFAFYLMFEILFKSNRSLGGGESKIAFFLEFVSILFARPFILAEPNLGQVD